MDLSLARVDLIESLPFQTFAHCLLLAQAMHSKLELEEARVREESVEESVKENGRSLKNVVDQTTCWQTVEREHLSTTTVCVCVCVLFESESLSFVCEDVDRASCDRGDGDMISICNLNL